MTCVPCKRDELLRQRIENLAEVLKTRSHELLAGEISEKDFYQSGLFRGAVERVRGQFSATMGPKREFMRHVLNYLQDGGLIKEWESAGGTNRFDYTVQLNSGRIAGIELKGCLDGNNTNIFARPPQAHEFVIWSVCSNPGADPRRNVWSGIHTRLGAEIIDKQTRIDGLVVWDMICGTIARPCPKLSADPTRVTVVGPYELPPPCLYLLPGTISSPKNNPAPAPNNLADVEILQVLNTAFHGRPDELYGVYFETRQGSAVTERLTRIACHGAVVQESGWTPMRRS